MHRSRRLAACIPLLAFAAVTGCSAQSAAPAPPSSPTPVAVLSPTPDSATRAYVAMVHNFWIQEQAADVASSGSNLAAKVCLGKDPPGGPTRLDLVEPARCGQIAVALLAVHETFLCDLSTTPESAQFAADDQVFRTQIPKTISELNALVGVARGGKSKAVLQA